MSARVETADSGFYRAVCRDDYCRSDNAQRNYWRGPHMSRESANLLAIDHNREFHLIPAVCNHCPNRATRILTRGRESMYLCANCGSGT